MRLGYQSQKCKFEFSGQVAKSSLRTPTGPMQFNNISGNVRDENRSKRSRNNNTARTKYGTVC